MQEHEIILGKVSENESEEIEYTLERLAGLEELLMIIDDEELKTTVKEEITMLRASSDSWWNKVSEKYGWDANGSDNWGINFLDRTVRLLNNEIVL